MSSGDINNAITAAYAAAVRDVRYNSVACLTLLVWNLFLTFDKDVQYIWTMRNKNPLKWAYFFLRYVVILACVMHNWLIGQLADGRNPPVLCNIWQVYVPGFAQSLVTLLELILAPRIFALYDRSKKIAFLLSILILTEFAGTMRMLWWQEYLAFYETCILSQMTETAKYQMIYVFIVHCVFIFLTLIKYFLAFKSGWNRTPLVSLVIRDGSTMYATITLILLSLLVVYDVGNERETAIFFWVVALLSISGCRMILSMERFARREISMDYPLFTSQISMPTSESDVQDQFASQPDRPGGYLA